MIECTVCIKTRILLSFLFSSYFQLLAGHVQPTCWGGLPYCNCLDFGSGGQTAFFVFRHSTLIYRGGLFLCGWANRQDRSQWLLGLFGLTILFLHICESDVPLRLSKNLIQEMMLPGKVFNWVFQKNVGPRIWNPKCSQEVERCFVHIDYQPRSQNVFVGHDEIWNTSYRKIMRWGRNMSIERLHNCRLISPEV